MKKSFDKFKQNKERKKHMSDKNINIKESVKMEDVNIQAREAVIKIANTMATAGNTIFFESVLFESTKSTIDLYEYVKTKKLKNWSLIKGAVSRAVNAGTSAWYMLIKKDGVDLDSLKSGTHDERINKLQQALKEHKISLNKAYKQYKDEKNPEQEPQQEPQQGSISTPSDSFNEALILLCQKFEEDLSAREIYMSLNEQAIFYKNKLTKKQIEKIEKVA